MHSGLIFAWTLVPLFLWIVFVIIWDSIKWLHPDSKLFNSIGVAILLALVDTLGYGIYMLCIESGFIGG
jgi:hypothetical protein